MPGLFGFVYMLLLYSVIVSVVVLSIVEFWRLHGLARYCVLLAVPVAVTHNFIFSHTEFFRYVSPEDYTARFILRDLLLGSNSSFLLTESFYAYLITRITAHCMGEKSLKVQVKAFSFTLPTLFVLFPIIQTFSWRVR